MKLRIADGWLGRSYNGGDLAADEFAYVVGTNNPSGEPKEIILPCRGGKFSRCVLRITRGPQDEATKTWHWDGNMDAPTLTPSIGCDHRCGWHGHLIAGEMTP